MQTPVMDGASVLKIIKESDKFKSLHIVALTANAMKGDRERFLSLGCDDYIAKPIDREIFNNKMKKLAEERSLEKI